MTIRCSEDSVTNYTPGRIRMMDILASLNLVRRTRSVPNTITVIGVRKALLIGQLVFIVTHYHETPLV